LVPDKSAVLGDYGVVARRRWLGGDLLIGHGVLLKTDCQPTVAMRQTKTERVGFFIHLPIHSLLFLEDACTAFAWLHHNGFSPITINEYMSMLRHRPTNFPGGAVLAPLKALGIPKDALSDKKVAETALRFRNSAYAYILAHEWGHILHRHHGNKNVPPDKSRADERQADEFALRVLKKDRQVPMGAILYFQMTAFTSGSPQRFDFATVEKWQEALAKATHPVTSDRILGLAKGLRDGANQYGPNREFALDVADQLKKLAREYDDRDWQLYFQRVGQRAELSQLQPRKE
jgi:hypothetical protein